LGCAENLAARGRFTGTVVAAVPIQTMDRERYTAYVIAVEEGPMFTRPGGNVAESQLSSAGEQAVLAKDRKGNVYRLDPRLVGRRVRVTGVMRLCVADADGKALGAPLNPELPRLPNYCIEVAKVEAVE
jgi:hypothetical protein